MVYLQELEIIYINVLAKCFVILGTLLLVEWSHTLIVFNCNDRNFRTQTSENGQRISQALSIG